VEGAHLEQLVLAGDQAIGNSGPIVEALL
jgi:hypothetical protein